MNLIKLPTGTLWMW